MMPLRPRSFTTAATLVVSKSPSAGAYAWIAALARAIPSSVPYTNASIETPSSVSGTSENNAVNAIACDMNAAPSAENRSPAARNTRITRDTTPPRDSVMTPHHLPVALVELVSVLVYGSFVHSAPPASLSDGHVVAPLVLVARIADRVEVSGNGTVTARRGERECRARALPGSDPALVALAPLARCLGASQVAWDGAAK